MRKLISLASLLTTACLGGPNAADGGGSARTDAGLDAGDGRLDASVDGGIWPDARALEQCPDPVEPSDGGAAQVLLRQTDAPGLTQFLQIFALSPPYRPAPEPDPTGCLDRCLVGQRYLPDGGPPDGGARDRLAGEISIRGLRTGTVALNPPYYVNFNELGFTRGEILQVSATGDPGALPSFMGSLETPPQIDLSPPTSASRTQDLLLSWTIASTRSAGFVELNIRGASLNHAGHGLERAVCLFPLSERVGRVPSAVLAEFDPGESRVTVVLRSEATVRAGTSTVSLTAESQIVWEAPLDLR